MNELLWIIGLSITSGSMWIVFTVDKYHNYYWAMFFMGMAGCLLGGTLMQMAEEWNSIG